MRATFFLCYTCHQLLNFLTSLLSSKQLTIWNVQFGSTSNHLTDLHSRNEASLQSSQSLSPHTSSICMWTWIPLSISKWLCNWHCFKEIQSINLYLLSTFDDSCYVNYQRMINDHVVADTQKIMNNNETVLIYLFRIDHMLGLS